MKAEPYNEPALKRPSLIAPLEERSVKAHGKVTWCAGAASAVIATWSRSRCLRARRRGLYSGARCRVQASVHCTT